VKRKELTGTLVCVALLLFAAVTWAVPVPDTGQTKCYNATVEIPCPSPGQPFYGQDANFSINPMSYTKLDGSGNALPVSATSWVMVRDNVTGLIWEVKTNKDGVPNHDDPHDADNMYSWYDSNPATNGGDPGISSNGTDTEDFINALNNAHFGGYSDWRLPTIKELAYIVNYSISYPGPTINADYFPNTVSSFYWSSTTSADGTYGAYGVDFYSGADLFYGYDFLNGKSSSYYVRAVRGGQSGSLCTYTDNGDGTVMDASTGLMWQQRAPLKWMTWKQALAYCERLNLGGHTDWRMPTIKELRSLVDYSRYEPAINTSYFQNTVASYYWSSTTYATYAYYAWGLYFYDGSVTGIDKSYSYLGWGFSYHVRAVRGCGMSQ
jgi:hypothetical protein